VTDMTDLELTKACAEASGMRQSQLFPLGDYPDQDGTYELMGDAIYRLSGNPRGGYNRYLYNPLHDDGQAMALVKHFKLSIAYLYNYVDGVQYWYCTLSGSPSGNEIYGGILNRAICECVANMQRRTNSEVGSELPTIQTR